MRAERGMRSTLLRYFRRDCRNTGRVKSTAHEDCRWATRQTRAHRLLEKVAKLFDIKFPSLQPQRPFDGQRRKPPNMHAASRIRQGVTGWKPRNIAKGGPGWVGAPPFQQEIADE